MRGKIWRTAVAVVLSGIFILNAVCPTAAAEAVAGFPDVPVDAWYAEPVRYLARVGIIGGKEDGKFHPEAQITRAEFLKLLAMASGKDLTSQRLGGSFSDVPENAWYTKYVYWGVREKIINGVGDGCFAPDSPITRQQIAVILWRYNKNALGKIMPRYQKTYFKDASAVSGWAKKEVEAVEGAGIICGYSDRTFRPQNNASRAEAAQILYKYLSAYREYKRGCSLDDLRYVMHGGGEVGGRYQVSNSLEALQEASRSQNRIVELDFSWTTDNQLVCLHNWGGAYPPKSTLNGFCRRRFMAPYNASRAEAAQILYKYLSAYREYKRGCSLDDLRYVMHGGGEVGGRYQVSNSLEALQEASRSQNRIVELDFSWTTDNQLVCLHNWGGAYPPKSTLNGFLQAKIYGALTPMGMESLSSWLRAHPEVQIVADFKERSVEGLRLISTYYPDLLGQFIPYLYHTSDYEAIHNLGYENMILIFYQMTAAERGKVKENVAFARDKALTAIAVSPDQKIEEYEAEAKKAGIPLLSFVIDSPTTMRSLAQQGTDGFITNKQTIKIQW